MLAELLYKQRYVDADADLLSEREWFFGHDYATCLGEYAIDLLPPF